MTVGEVVAREVAAAVAATHGPIGSWRGPLPRDWSWHFHAETTGRRPTALIVKIPRWDQAPTLEAAIEAGVQRDTTEEFAALHLIRDAVAAAGDPGLAAVVPVVHVTSVNAIVMERLRARSLGDRIGIGRGRDAGTLFTRVGRWLRVFHDATGWERRPLTITRAQDVPSALRTSARAVEAAWSAREGETVPTGVTHGDLTLGNVLVTIDDRIAVIDPNRTPGRLSQDVARLMGEVRLGRSQLATKGAFRPASVVDTWLERVLAGHGALDTTMTQVELADEALHRWGQFEERGGAWSVAAVVARSMFRKEIRRRIGAASGG